MCKEDVPVFIPFTWLYHCFDAGAEEAFLISEVMTGMCIWIRYVHLNLYNSKAKSLIASKVGEKETCKQEQGLMLINDLY